MRLSVWQNKSYLVGFYRVKCFYFGKLCDEVSGRKSSRLNSPQAGGASMLYPDSKGQSEHTIKKYIPL